MSVWSEVGNVFVDSIDTAGDFIESLGTNAIANADANAARVESIRIKNQLAKQKFQSEELRKAKQMDLLQNIVYVVLAVALIIVLSKTLIPIFKKAG